MTYMEDSGNLKDPGNIAEMENTANIQELVFHPGRGRGLTNLGWLQSRHSFSFGGYYSPDRMGFGSLRVLNDDRVIEGAGFDTHPHQNMEIVSIPLAGALEHQDSAGNRGIIQAGDVQIMSAGTGIMHSEYNHSAEEPVHFLQIWILPEELDIKPRYEQSTYRLPDRGLLPLVGPNANSAVRINQQAYFSIGVIPEQSDLSYSLHSETNGLYVFLLEGSIQAGKRILKERDAVGIGGSPEAPVSFHGLTPESRLLLIEVPPARNQ